MTEAQITEALRSFERQCREVVAERNERLAADLAGDGFKRDEVAAALAASWQIFEDALPELRAKMRRMISDPSALTVATQ